MTPHGNINGDVMTTCLYYECSITHQYPGGRWGYRFYTLFNNRLFENKVFPTWSSRVCVKNKLCFKTWRIFTICSGVYKSKTRLTLLICVSAVDRVGVNSSKALMAFVLYHFPEQHVTVAYLWESQGIYRPTRVCPSPTLVVKTEKDFISLKND